VNQIALFYPCESLAQQVGAWARRYPQYTVKSVFTKRLPDIRDAIQGVDAAIVDATGDHAQAADAFSQAATQLGPQAALVYTEGTDEQLELFVRSRGSLVLFGPLEQNDWDGLFQHTLRQGRGRRLAA
jgi:hypothetical protein